MLAVRSLTTNRSHGNMSAAAGEAAAGRALAAEKTGIPESRFVWLGQVHGSRVAVVDELWPESSGPLTIAETDAVVTRLPGVVLAVVTADCVPMLAQDARAGVIGAAHAGRRGAQSGVARELVAAMAALGADPSRIEASLGPCASGARYEVPAQMRDEVEAALPGSACVTETGAAGLDLRGGLARQLQELGVRAVESSAVCTIRESSHFSHRGGDWERFATLIWMADGPQS